MPELQDPQDEVMPPLAPEEKPPLKVESMEHGRQLLKDLESGNVPKDMEETVKKALLDFRTSPEAQAAQANVVEPRSEQNFFERVGEDLKHRFGEQGAEIINRRVAGDQGFWSTAAQLTGKVGYGSIVDVIGEVVVSGGRGLSNITPDVIEDPIKENATKAGYYLLNTELGMKGMEAAQAGMEKWGEFKGENPVMAANIEALTNTVLLASPVKVKQGAVEAVKRGGQAISNSAAIQALAQNNIVRGAANVAKNATPKSLGNRAVASSVKKAAKDKASLAYGFVREPSSKKQGIQEALRQTTSPSGPLQAQGVFASPWELKMASEVKKLNITPHRSLQHNLNVIVKAADDEVASLAKQLNKTKIPFRPSELKAELDHAIANIPKALTGDAGKMATEVTEELYRILGSKGKPTLPKLLKARKELDRFIKKQKGEGVMDPVRESAMSIATREIRQTTNNFIAARAPKVAVRQSLDKSWKLYSGAENLATRARLEGTNALTRSLQRAIKILPFRSEFNNIMAAMFGVGGLGAAAKFAPYFTKIALGFGGLYVGGKLIMHSQTRKMLGKSLLMIDDAIKATSDVALQASMRADRAILVEIMKTAEENDKE